MGNVPDPDVMSNFGSRCWSCRAQQSWHRVAENADRGTSDDARSSRDFALRGRAQVDFKPSTSKLSGTLLSCSCGGPGPALSIGQVVNLDLFLWARRSRGRRSRSRHQAVRDAEGDTQRRFREREAAVRQRVAGSGPAPAGARGTAQGTWRVRAYDP